MNNIKTICAAAMLTMVTTSQGIAEDGSWDSYCEGGYNAMQEYLLNEYDEVPLGLGRLNGDTFNITIFTNEEMGTFTLVYTDRRDGTSCISEVGRDWVPVER